MQAPMNIPAPKTHGDKRPTLSSEMPKAAHSAETPTNVKGEEPVKTNVVTKRRHNLGFCFRTQLLILL